jgi:hypothetical protein
MTLIKSIYIDKSNRIWEVEKYYLPNKKGTPSPFWRAECKDINVAYSGKLKSSLMTQIRWYIKYGYVDINQSI